MERIPLLSTSCSGQVPIKPLSRNLKQPWAASPEIKRARIYQRNILVSQTLSACPLRIILFNFRSRALPFTADLHIVAYIRLTARAGISRQQHVRQVLFLEPLLLVPLVFAVLLSTLALFIYLFIYLYFF